MALFIFYYMLIFGSWILAFAAGIKFSAFLTKRSVIIAIAALIPAVAELYLVYHPVLLVKYLFWPDYSFFKGISFAGPLFCLGMVQSKCSRRLQQLTRFFIAALLFMALFHAYLVLESQYPDFKEKPQLNGICMQSKPYTCSPAACVTFLNQFDIHTTESQMAVLCLTSPKLGTSRLNIIRGLQLAADAKKYQIQNTFHGDFETLKHAPLPAISFIRLSPKVYHTIVILNILEDSVIIADPLEGKHLVKTSLFLKNWNPDFITMTKIR